MTREDGLAWVDGLRGLASLGVVSSHLSTMVSQQSFHACCEPGTSSPSWRQLPPLRLLAVGHAWLCMFFILSAFIFGVRVLDILEHYGQSSAYHYLATSTFKRPLRLALPAAVATTIAWLVVQIDGFEPARRVVVLLLSMYIPDSVRPWSVALKQLWSSIARTWIWLGPSNKYDNMQWSLVYMLQGSFLCSAILLSTLQLRTSVRLLVLGLVWYLGWDWSKRLVDPLVTPAYITGLAIAHVPFTSRLSPLLLPLAVVLMCFAKNDADKVLWTEMIQRYYLEHMPKTLDIERGVAYLGCSIFVLAVKLSPDLQRVFGSGQWLGKASFGIYLLHMTVIRVVLPWLAYFDNPMEIGLHGNLEVASFTQPVPAPRLAGAIVGILALLITLGELWSQTVDPACEYVLGALVKWARRVTKSKTA